MPLNTHRFLLMLLGSCLLVLGLWLPIRKDLMDTQSRLDALTPIAVMSRSAWVQRLAPNANRTEMADSHRQFLDQVKKLQEAGYLVIDSSAVIEAPKEIRIP